MAAKRRNATAAKAAEKPEKGAAAPTTQRTTRPRRKAGTGTNGAPTSSRKRVSRARPSHIEAMPTLTEELEFNGHAPGNGGAPSNGGAPVARERIALEAYFIWERSGRPSGQADDHWLEAESKLRATG